MDLLNHHRLDISLAIIDVFMPLVSGFELIRRLTEDKAELKIIAISDGRRFWTLRFCLAPTLV
jgi:CheY-like chemotaxis protein